MTVLFICTKWEFLGGKWLIAAHIVLDVSVPVAYEMDLPSHSFRFRKQGFRIQQESDEGSCIA